MGFSAPAPRIPARTERRSGRGSRSSTLGAHRDQALPSIDETLTIVVNDLLKRPDRADFLSVPRDCGDLLASLQPLRAAVAGANAAQTPTMALIEQLIAFCPGR